MYIYIGLTSLVVIAIVVIAARSLLVPADVIAASTATTPSGRALVERFVGRSRRFRTLGGVVGVALSLLVTSVQTDSSDVTIGFLPALAGAVIGSIVAESFRVRRSRGPRSANLDVRMPTGYTDDVADGREYAVGVAWLVLTGLGVAHQDLVTIGLGAVVGLVAAGRRWAQRRVALRGRPALDDDLAAADDDVRRMAVRHGIARPMVTLMTLLVAGQAAALQPYYPEAGTMRSVLGLASLALTITSLVWWWTNRNFGFAALEPRRSRAVAVSTIVVAGIVLVLLVAVRFGG